MRNFDISDLVEIYNHAPQVLLKNTVKVSLTKESLINSTNEVITLTNDLRGNYCIFSTEDENYWLFPKKNLKNNDFNSTAIKCLFKCDYYYTQETGLLILTKPAKVARMSSGIDWKLEELGEINFVDLPSSSDLQFQVELANQKIAELESQLGDINRKHNLETNELKSNLELLKLQHNNEIQQLTFKYDQEIIKLQSQLELLPLKHNVEIELLQFQLEELTKEGKLLQNNLQTINDNFKKEPQNYNPNLEEYIQENQKLLSWIKDQLSNEFSNVKNYLTEIKQTLLTQDMDIARLSNSYIDDLHQSVTENNLQEPKYVDHDNNPEIKYPIIQDTSWLNNYNANPDLFAQYQPIVVTIKAERKHSFECRRKSATDISRK